MKQGDWILCKQDYYDGDLISNGTLIGKKYIGVRKLFDYIIPQRNQHFKKGNKYQIKNVFSNRVPLGGTGGLYNSNVSPNYHTYISYSIERSDKQWEQFSNFDIKVLFYSKQEERALKLKKLNSI